MARGQFYCPADECRYNHGGTCACIGDNIRTPVNVVQYSARIYGEDIYNSLPGGTTGHTDLATRRHWQSWENCPYIHRHEI